MIPAEHPCLSAQAHFRYGRIHLPVAPRCNIRCGYCDRRYDCANESRPGVTSEVISPEAALDRVERALRLDSRLRVAGVAGPGEPLANPATLETLRLVRSRFPGLLLCLSTNGLVLSDALPELLDCGVSTLTVTVNTRSVVCAGHVYRTVGGSADAGAMAAFLSAQQEGVAKAAEAGLTVKINTVVSCRSFPKPAFGTTSPPAKRSWMRCAPRPVSISPSSPTAGSAGRTQWACPER